MKLEINIDDQAIQEEALKLVQNKAASAARNIVARRFQTGQYSGETGDLYLYIKDKIEDMTASDEFDKLLDNLIEKHLNDATENAVKLALRHLAQKKVFVERV